MRKMFFIFQNPTPKDTKPIMQKSYSQEIGNPLRNYN